MTFDNNFAAISQDYLMPKVTDTVLRGNILPNLFLTRGKPWSGKKYTLGVQTEKPTGGKSVSGMERFNTNLSETKQKMEFDIRMYTQPIVISGIEAVVNGADKQASVNYINETMEEAQNALADTLGTMLYSDGTGATGGSGSNKDFLGLNALDDDGDGVATIGGLSRSTYTTLRSTVVDVTGGTGLVSLVPLQTGFAASRYGGKNVDVLITSDVRFDDFENLLQPTVIANIEANGYGQMTRFGYVPSTKALGNEAGFNSIKYRGVSVVADQKCADAKMYGLSFDSLLWVGADPSAVEGWKTMNLANNKEIEGVYSDEEVAGMGIGVSKFQTPIDQFGQIAHLAVIGNFIVKNPRRNFRIDFA